MVKSNFGESSFVDPLTEDHLHKIGKETEKNNRNLRIVSLADARFESLIKKGTGLVKANLYKETLKPGQQILLQGEYKQLVVYVIEVPDYKENKNKASTVLVSVEPLKNQQDLTDSAEEMTD